MQTILDYLPLLLKGAWLTLAATALSMGGGSIIGLLACMMCLSAWPVARRIAFSYIALVRGLPLITGIRLPAITAGTIALSLFTGAYLAEIFRAGIQAIPSGQSEAARSLGLSRLRSLQLVILPQALRKMTPAIANQFSITLKDTSLLSVIGVGELTMAGQSIYSANFDAVRVLTMVGIIYFVIVTGALRLTKRFGAEVRPA